MVSNEKLNVSNCLFIKNSSVGICCNRIQSKNGCLKVFMSKKNKEKDLKLF